MITLKDLSIGYARQSLAQHLNAHFQSGKLTALLGRNGVGKSTLLRCIAGLHAPLSGEIFVAETALQHLDNSRRAKSIALVLTAQPVAPNLRVRELVSLGRLPYLELRGKLTAKDESIVERAMAQCSISGFAHREVGQLSDGERQRTMLARALAQDTPILLLDEATAFLDYPSKIEMFTLLRHIARDDNKCIVISTHDVEIALSQAQHFALLDRQGIFQGNLDELCANANFRADFCLPR